MSFLEKKEHPDVAYRSHELFDMTAPRGAMEGGQEGVRPKNHFNVHKMAKQLELPNHFGSI